MACRAVRGLEEQIFSQQVNTSKAVRLIIQTLDICRVFYYVSSAF